MAGYKLGGVGFVIVTLETRYDTDTGVKGLNNLNIVIDGRYEPLKYANPVGKVIQVPFSMGERPIKQEQVGLPGYGPVNITNRDDCHSAIYKIGGVYKYKRLNDIVPEVEIGDTIWFQPMAVHRSENILDEETISGKKIYTLKIDYDLIICVEKPSAPKMIGGHCFLAPYQWDKSEIPTYYDTLDSNGNRVARPKAQWLCILTPPTQVQLKAILKHFGTPLKGETFNFNTNDTLFIKRNLKWRFKYKNEEFILLRQWELFAKLELNQKTVNK